MSFNINDLVNPEALPDATANVSLVQTHISYVIIADNYVYKIKKAVNFGFLDFSTLEKRKYYCRREIDLNRRLSDGLYVDVLPVYCDGNYCRIGEGNGEAIEYAVKMKRLPDDMLMKSLFEKGLLTREHILKISGKIAQFHRDANYSSDIERFGDPEMFRVNTDENFHQTEKYRDITIDKEDFERIRKWTDDFYRSNKNLFYERIKNNFIRDCHGDLHMEHICLTESIPIFDCIEFNERFRYTDTLADIAFLLMDLEYRGGNEFAELLWQDYSRLTGAADMISLLKFYKVYRAYVRGKVISFQLDDENIDKYKKDEAEASAKRYFQLAGKYVQ
ncbi:MAG: gluconokinase [Deltaproteobacteria bacterium]|nr:gluconokinase [Deltaproteobacteria bacterium]